MGLGGQVAGLTKTALKTSLETEMSEHLCYDKHGLRAEPRNSRNGTRPKTLLTEIDPTEIKVTGPECRSCASQTAGHHAGLCAPNESLLARAQRWTS